MKNYKTNAGLTFHADKPIASIEEDRLGFSPIADNLATSILKMKSDDGFVISIEGPWGSGKSSILNLLCLKLENDPNVSIIKFSPWMIGNRDSMVSSLMEELSHSIEKITGKKDVSKEVRKYGETLADIASASPDPYGVGAIIGVVLKRFCSSKSLNEIKGHLAQSLLEIGRTFVIIVDDLDRLEPEEALEVMRLIRAVGDFPNVIYLLCYDKEILSESLKTALSIQSGSVYLQKIIQASFSVPKPEEFDLRNWLNAECHLLYREIAGKTLPDNLSDRLKDVCYTHGGKIETPREINLILNSLKLAFPPIANSVDFPDLCWLHIEKIKNDAFYRWVENYLNIFSVLARGEGSLDEAAKAKITQELFKHLGVNDDADKEVCRSAIINLLGVIPGIDYMWGDGKTLIMNQLTAEELSALEVQRRLGSPSHYRLYFSFAQPAGTLDDSELFGIINKANEQQLQPQDFDIFISKKRRQGGTMYSVLLDRLKRANTENLSSDGCISLLHAIVANIDDARREEKDDERDFRVGIGEIGKGLFQKLLSKIEQRDKFIKDFFTNGTSIGWLVSNLLRHEIFAHGRSGFDKQGQPWLTEDELDTVIVIINNRLVGADRDKIKTVPDVLSFFYGWQQSGDEGAKSLKEWMDEATASDKGFLEILEKCRSYVMSSAGNYSPLNDREINQLIGDTETVLNRLQNIASNQENEPLLVQKANELIEAHKLSRRF